MSKIPAAGRRGDVFIGTLAGRLLQGFALCSVMVVAATRAANLADSVPLFAALVLSATACGMACGTTIDCLISRKLGQQVAMAVDMGCLAAGLLALGLVAGVYTPAVAGFLIGVGIATDWSAAARVAGLSLPNAGRWTGMRWWTVCFPLGMVIGSVAATGQDTLAVAAMLAVALTVVICLLRPFSIPSTSIAAIETDVPALPLDASAASDLANTATPARPESGEQSPDDTISREQNTDGDESECCGGVSRTFVPTSFRHGVLLATVGLFTLLGPTYILLEAALLDPAATSAVMLTVGLASGYWLMFSAAPRVGYVILLLPYCVGSLLALAAFGLKLAPLDSWPVGWFVCGLFPGGVICGTSAVIGELFTDDATDSQRSRLLAVSLCLTATLLLASGLGGLLMPSSRALLVAESLIFLSGLFLLRLVPSPVRSSLGSEEHTTDHDGELEELMSALHN